MKIYSGKGQAFLFTFMVLLFAGILAAGLSAVWQSEVRLPPAHRDSDIAFYLAQAGIEHAKIWARYNPNSALWGANPYDNSWRNFGSGRYRFLVQDLGAANRRLSAQGQALDSAGNALAERQIIVDINGIENPNSNLSNDCQAVWSWREN